jgi:hypothetical protein
MLLVEAKALVTYTCTLTDEDEQKVRLYAEENDLTLNESIKELWDNEEIDVYANDNITESDSDTQEVGYSQFNR